MFSDLFEGWHIVLLLVVVVLLFGSRRLPEGARALGRSLRIFKAEVRGLHEDEVAAPGAVVASVPVAGEPLPGAVLPGAVLPGAVLPGVAGEPVPVAGPANPSAGRPPAPPASA